MKNKKISVYSFDLRGHGRSGGKKGHIDRFMDYTDDIGIFIKLVRGEQEKLPILMLGTKTLFFPAFRQEPKCFA